MSSDLTLPAIPGLLRKCSPVCVPGMKCGSGVVVDHPSDRVAWVRVLMDSDDDGPSPVDRVRVFLDLTDATGRAHAAWWLTETLIPGRAPFGAWWRNLGDGRWSLRCGSDWRTFRSPGSPEKSDFRPEIPALADLEPNDDLRLPDGSRRVDAEALRRVVLHVAGVPA